MGFVANHFHHICMVSLHIPLPISHDRHIYRFPINHCCVFFLRVLTPVMLDNGMDSIRAFHPGIPSQHSIPAFHPHKLEAVRVTNNGDIPFLLAFHVIHWCHSQLFTRNGGLIILHGSDMWNIVVDISFMIQ